MGVWNAFSRLSELSEAMASLRIGRSVSELSKADQESIELVRQIWHCDEPAAATRALQPTGSRQTSSQPEPFTDVFQNTQLIRRFAPIDADTVQVKQVRLRASSDSYEVYKQTRDSTGYLYGQVGGGGTGWTTDPGLSRIDGLAVTNTHVVSAVAWPLKVAMADGEKFNARLVGVMPRNDIALVHFEGIGNRVPFLKTADYYDRVSTQPGDALYMNGHPSQNALAIDGTYCLGCDREGKVSFEPSLSEGVFNRAALERGGEFLWHGPQSLLLSSTAPRFPGYSGAALGKLNPDREFRVLGVHSTSTRDGHSLASASVVINPALEFIGKSGLPETGFLKLTPKLSNGKFTFDAEPIPFSLDANGLLDQQVIHRLLSEK